MNIYPNSSHPFPVKMPLYECAIMGPEPAQCWQHWAGPGPIMAHYGMFTWNIFGTPANLICFELSLHLSMSIFTGDVSFVSFLI